MIIRRSLTPLNSSRTLRAVRQRETVRGSDDNSPRKVQNVRTHSSVRISGTHSKTSHHPGPEDKASHQDRPSGEICKTSIPGSNPGGASNFPVQIQRFGDL
jgi:hypothetical protein